MGFEEFGRYLGQQRELRGLTREDMSRSTKIPPSLLEALELGQVERLPERVFVVNFVRSYAHVLGLEEEETLLRFQEVERNAEEGLTHGRTLKPPKLSRQGTVWAIVLMVLLLGGLTGWLVWNARQGPQVAAPVRSVSP